MNEVSTKKLKPLGINVCSIEIIVCHPILHLVFQAPQLSASQYQKRIRVRMKFPMQHNHGTNKTMINMWKRQNKMEKDREQTKQ